MFIDVELMFSVVELMFNVAEHKIYRGCEIFLTSRFGYYLGFAPLFVEVPQAPYHRQN